MTKKIGDKKLNVSSTSATRGVQKTEGIDRVDGVAPTSSVSGVGSASAVGKRRATRVMSLQEREALMQMISDEAEKLFSEGRLPESQKALVTSAVKMAVDAGILPEADDSKE